MQVIIRSIEPYFSDRWGIKVGDLFKVQGTGIFDNGNRGMRRGYLIYGKKKGKALIMYEHQVDLIK